MKHLVAVLAALLVSAWLIGPAFAQEEQEDGSQPTYISFQLPANNGFQNLFVNNKMTVAATYYSPAGGQAAFVRDSRGTITQISPPGSVATIVAGINAHGTIAGWYFKPPRYYGFIRDPNGAITTLDIGISTLVDGINTAGTIVGTDPSQAYVRDAEGSITYFSGPGGVSAFPTSVNDAGAIAGIWFDAQSRSHGFVRSPQGTITSFDPEPGVTGFNTLPSINRSGVIVGSYFTGSYITGYVLHSFERSPQGVVTPIDIPPAGSTLVTAINDSGTIVGSSSGHGFALSPQGSLTSFDVPGSASTAPLSINNRGVIAGTYVTFPQFVTSGFLRLPAGFESEDDR